MIDNLQQQKIWRVLHDQITETMDQFGVKGPFRGSDYWLLDEDWGWERHQLEVQNLRLLHPDIIFQLQRLLQPYPKWDITVRVDVPGKEKEWPGMGVIIHSEEIVDELQREFLPEDIRKFSYSRPTANQG